MCHYNVTNELPNIAVPTLIIAANKDPMQVYTHRNTTKRGVSIDLAVQSSNYAEKTQERN